MALTLTLVVAVLPTRWLAWTGDVADIARIPIMPLAGVGSRVAGVMRPVNMQRGVAGTVEDMLHVESQRDRLERLLLQEQLRVAEMERKLRHIQGLPPLTRTAQPPLLLESEVTGRRPDHPISGVELHAPAEAAGRVQVGDAVTWDGRWLVGRITRVSDIRLSALPITHPDVGPMMGVLLPEGIDMDVDVVSAPVVRLRQDGNGKLLGEIDRRTEVGIGDRVVLADRAWPASLQAFHVGRVTSVQDIDEAPLRRRLVIEPDVHLYELPWVVIVGRDGTDGGKVVQ